MLATRTHQGIFGSLIIAIAALFASLALASPVAADGNGSPEACKTGINAAGGQDARSYTAPAGQVVTGVCIKSGEELGHTGVLGNGSYDGNGIAGGTPACYTVSGVGTATVTVTRIGSGSDCQGLSHVDVALGTANTGGGGGSSVPGSSSAAASSSAPASSTPASSAPAGSGTLGGSGGPGGSTAASAVVRGAVAGGQGGPGAGSLPNTAVPAELAGSIGGLLMVLSGIAYAVNRRRDS